MATSLRVSCLQNDIFWEHPEKNCSHFETILNTTDQADLYILPETFSTGFSIKPALAETMDGTTVGWMKKMAKHKNAAILGSLIINENSKIYNRLLLVSADGSIQHYNKQHLFNYGSEGKHFTKGTTTMLFKYKDWLIKPIICYDLRFPVTIRNTEDYDLLVCIANWPNTRVDAWDTLLKARAIENQCYAIGVNRVGDDGNNLTYSGHSNCYDPLGKALFPIVEKPEVLSLRLEKETIENTRSQLPFLNDRDTFTMG